MKIPGQHLNSHVGQLAARLDPAYSNVTKHEAALCEAKVMSRNVFLEAHSPFDRERPMRPYLHILGMCTGIKADFPYGVTDLDFTENPINVDYFYEFTNEELADLATKGLFDKGFRVPDIMFGNEFRFPATCDYLVVAPDKDGDTPIIFAEVLDAHNREICTENCGYNFARDNFEATPEDEKYDEFIDEIGRVVEVKDSMFDEKENEQEAEIIAVEEVPTPEEIKQRVHLEAQYARIRERERAHIDRKMTQNEVVERTALSEEAEARFAAQMAEHKELDPLPDIEEVQVLEPIEVEYTAEEVPIAPAAEPDVPTVDDEMSIDDDIEQKSSDDIQVEEREDISMQSPDLVRSVSKKNTELADRLRAAAADIRATEVADESDELDIDDSI